jgi:hypothetical protein
VPHNKKEKQQAEEEAHCNKKMKAAIQGDKGWMVKKGDTNMAENNIISTSHHQVDCWWGVIKAACDQGSICHSMHAQHGL